jgi:hypothetical protein
MVEAGIAGLKTASKILVQAHTTSVKVKPEYRSH